MPGYEISASNASSANSASGAVKFGNQNLGNGVVGGSVGISTTMVLSIVGGLVGFWFFFLRKGANNMGLFGIGGSQSATTSLSVQQSTALQAMGANSLVLAAAAIKADQAKKVLAANSTDKSIVNKGGISAAGNLDNSTKYGNNNVINPDSTALTTAALNSVGNALNTAISNRDVISPVPVTAQQIGTQTPTTGLVDSVSSFFNSGTVKLALFIAFPILGLILWSIFRKKKNA